MTDILDWREISARIREFLIAPRAILFAGAGVGQRAGLVGWAEYVEHLASTADRYEPNIAAVIRQRARAGSFAEAAQFYRLCQIADGAKYAALAEPFDARHYDASQLKPLVSLPFDCIVTTNWDRSLLDAWASVRGTAPDVAELNDETLKAATHWVKPFIARVHGRAEIPASMAMTTTDFETLARDDVYIEFVSHVFKHNRCLIIGYSFLDPAIENVLQRVHDLTSLGAQTPHLALLPAGSDALAARLAELNIECLYFRRDESDPFSELWGSISDAARALAGATPAAHMPSALEPARHLLSSAYVRAKMTAQLPALRDVVLEGAVLGILSGAGLEGLTLLDVAAEIHESLALTVEEAERVIGTPLETLIAAGACELRGDHYVSPQLENSLEKDIVELARGVIHRFNLRRGGRTARDASLAISEDRLLPIVQQCLEHAVLVRGWDLGAEFAGASIQPDVWKLLADLVEDKGRMIPPDLRFDLTAASFDVLTKPTEKEAKILAPVGRLAFAVDIILQHGRGPLLHRRVLPERIYLDSNVAMPAITNGHPLQQVYMDALNAWRNACLSSGFKPHLVISDAMGEEILFHRSKAIELVRDLDLESPAKLRRHVLLQQESTNVFISAYATAVARSRRARKFRDWIAENAPYSQYAGLRRFLIKQGIDLVSSALAAEDLGRLGAIRGALEGAYRNDELMRYDPKPQILIQHEVRQLALLDRDLRRGQRALFVSADRRLRRLAVGPALGIAGAAMVSHIGLFQMLDLLIGVKTSAPSVARLLWGVQIHDQRTVIRNYLTDLALRVQDEALVLTLPQLVDAIVEASGDEAESEQLKFWSGAPKEQRKASEFMDRVTDDFYELMDEAVTKYKRERGEAI